MPRLFQRDPTSPRWYFSVQARSDENMKRTLSSGILLHPLACGLVVFRPVLLIDLSNFRHERVVGVWVCEQRRDGQQHLRYGKRRTPLILQYIQANRTICIHVAMIDLRREMTLRRLERIISWKSDVEEEDATSVCRVRRAHYGRLPIEHIIAHWSSRAIRRRIVAQVGQLFVD